MTYRLELVHFPVFDVITPRPYQVFEFWPNILDKGSRRTNIPMREPLNVLRVV